MKKGRKVLYVHKFEKARHSHFVIVGTVTSTAIEKTVPSSETNYVMEYISLKNQYESE